MDTIVIRENRGTSEYSVDALVAGERIIFLEGDVSREMAQDFVKKIMFFARADSESPVKVFINSPGGSVDAGMLMYDVIQSSPVPLEMYCLGRAYSMAALLFACGKDGRYLLPHSKVMIHEPSVESGAGGKTSSVLALAKDMSQTKDEIDALLAKHTGQDLAKIAAMTLTDHFFTAREAVEFGLADGVMNFNEMLA